VDEIDDTALRNGDIYVGKVNHIVKNIDAAFVEVQKGVTCYLPISNKKAPKITQGMEFPVQITKAAVKSKQAVVSTKLEFAGKYAVLTTQNLSFSISGKIKNAQERERLSELLNHLKDTLKVAELGIILRTNCENTETAVIENECRRLAEKAQDVLRYASGRTCYSKLYTAPPEFIKVLCDAKSGRMERIITDEPEVYELLKTEPDLSKENIVFYEDSEYSLDKLLGIRSKLKKAMDKHVWMKSGASLVIEPTEALTVIDVNTEKAIAGKRNSETTFFKINREAAKEAARQIRIRNLSGIILIDFIEMKEQEHIRTLLQELEEELQKDDVRSTVVDITKLGLVEITRMKVRKPLSAFCIKDSL
jgi:ribonuclease G